MIEEKIIRCIVPDCNKQLPSWRIRDGNITCSKKCANAWNRISSTTREKIRGKEYNHASRKF